MEDPKPPRYMSDKAKGKQRAEPMDLAALAPRGTLSAPAQDYSPNIKFSIRFTDGAQDLRLDLPTTKRVAALVEAVGPSLLASSQRFVFRRYENEDPTSPGRN